MIQVLYKLTYERVTLDSVNKKLIRPVPGLVIDGRQYFEFVNTADMPRGRLVHYNYMREEMIMGIDRELQMKFIDKLMEANAEKDTNRIGSLLYMFKDILSNITTVEVLYNMSSLVYFDAKEDIGTYDLDYNQQKIKQFKSIKDKSFFFTYLLQNALNNTVESLPSDIQKFLNENAVRLNAWMQILSETTD